MRTTDETTPLSDAMKPVVEGGEAADLAAFHAAFLAAELGLIMHGLPAHPVGEYRVGAGPTVTAEVVGTPDNRTMVKACADPSVFVRRYDDRVNALMRGREILEMVNKMPNVDGVLVCSAASFHSIVILREDIPRLLETAKPWWKFW